MCRSKAGFQSTLNYKLSQLEVGTGNEAVRCSDVSSWWKGRRGIANKRKPTKGSKFMWVLQSTACSYHKVTLSLEDTESTPLNTHNIKHTDAIFLHTPTHH